MNDGPISALAQNNETEDTEVPDENPLDAVSDALNPSTDSTPVNPQQTVPSTANTDNTNPTNGTVDTTSDSTAPSTTKNILVESATTDSPTAAEDKPESQEDMITRLLMASIAPIGNKANFKMMIYGDPGNTKSSWLGGAANQLIYDQEDGLISIKGAPRPPKPNIRAIPFKSFQQAEWLIDRLAKRIPELEWVEVFSIDTYNDFADKALDEIMAELIKRQPSRSNVPDTDEYTENNRNMLRIARRLRDLDRNIIITAHSKTVEPKNKPSQTYPAFSESLAKKLEAMMDIVAYVEMREIDGVDKPVFLVSGNAGVHAKNRIGLKGEFIDPTYDFFLEQWEKYRVEHPDEFEQ